MEKIRPYDDLTEEEFEKAEKELALYYKSNGNDINTAMSHLKGCRRDGLS